VGAEQGRPRLDVIGRYDVKLAGIARRAFAGALERREPQRIRAALEPLADNPRPPNCVAMQGEDSL